ncbi:topology modulation protein [Anaerobacillus sp. 1_MG-2023]|uniref:topology modulation protein n=1 Tax=Anaerobacillus sp. 1_MG-2023 TaxID=3062655 RepID=UPI0026E32C91|nr:topology modulation protein [Anaerobacillus sp. 1_MG-2023]MDO6655249.1 topology modulation protein [Anaerobacillus sp. 1_MG-2023]
MNRIMVMGSSGGAGKSTFARRLGEILDLKVYHLDTLFWKPNWVETSLVEFRDTQQKIAMTEKWIMEGNYSNSYDIRVARADTIIYLDVPRWLCIYRVLKRWVTHIGQTRPDMGKGCKEKVDWSFLTFIWTTYYPRKEKMRSRFEQLEQTSPDKTIIHLKNKADIANFLHELHSKHTILS